MTIAYYRGLATVELTKEFPDLKGSMMAVGCSKEEVEPLISSLNAKEVRVACYNSPTSLTISGDEPAIDELQKLMDERQIFNRKLQVNVAYHSHHMNLVAKNYRKCLQSIASPSCTQVKFHSSLLGHLVDGSRLESQYWVDNLTQSVRFSEAMTSMCASSEEHKTGINMIVEIGPHSALAGPIKQILKSCGKDTMKIPYMSALVRKKDAVETAVDLAASLFTRGVNLDLGAVNITSPRNPPSLLIDMPRYPWNHTTKYWHEPRLMRKHKSRSLPRHDLLGTLANYSNDLEPTWRNILRIDDIPWLRHHQIQSLTLFPMSAFIGLAVEAAHQKATWSGLQYDKFELRDVIVSTPLMLTEEEVEITLQLRPNSEDISGSCTSCDEFKIQSWAANKGWTEHCKGFISLKTKSIDTENLFDNVNSKISRIKDVATTVVEKSKIYDSLAELGVSYGSSFQGMNDCQSCEHSSTAHVIVPDTRLDMPKEHQTEMILHPALLEQIIELYWPILGAGKSFDTVYLPSSIGQLTISREIANISASPGSSLEAFCQGIFPSLHPKPTKVSMFAVNGEKKADPVIVLNDLTISPIVEMELESENDAHRELCFKLDWEPIFEPSTEVSLNGEPDVKDTPNSAPLEQSTDYKYPEIVLVHGGSSVQRQLASTLSTAMERLTGKVPEAGILGEVDANDKLSIFIMELETPLLSTLSSDQFVKLQKSILSSRGVLWAVRGAYSHSSNPDANMVTGLSRSIRSETTLKFSTLDLDPESSISEKESAQAIVRILEGVFGPNAGPNCELEFSHRQGKLFTPRIINDSEMNEYVHKKTKASALEPTLFAQDGRPLKMVIGNPGSLDTLHFVDSSSEGILGDDEIELEVKAIGVNPADVIAALGEIESDGFGCECSGVVNRTGSNVTSLAIGDRVAGISMSPGGVYSTFARSNSGFFFKIPDETSFEAAATIPMAYCSAYYGLHEVGIVTPDDTVLVHGATCALGQAAINVAQSLGAKVFATVGSTEPKEFLTKKYGLATEQILVGNNASFDSNTLQQTHLGCFDLVLNCTSTDTTTLREISACLHNFGRFIDLVQQKNLGKLVGGNNRTCISVDMMSVGIERPMILKRLISHISECLTDHKILPPSYWIFSISETESAFKKCQSGSFDCKLVISPGSRDMEKVSGIGVFESDMEANQS
jgi:NADPH:quinone reductase-like Zn-dependent oxidoreductase/malonyl CoA-acyl carrier protein transacylase